MDELQALLEGARHQVDALDSTNPVKVAYTLKQLARDAALGEGVGQVVGQGAGQGAGGDE